MRRVPIDRKCGWSVLIFTSSTMYYLQFEISLVIQTLYNACVAYAH